MALYLFMIAYWWARFVVSVSTVNEFAKFHLGNGTVLALLYMFVFFDAFLVCANFAILLRRVWNSAIIGGNYFLTTRFAVVALQLLFSVLPKQVLLYFYFR